MNARHVGRGYFMLRKPPSGMSYTEYKLAIEIAIDRATTLLADDACQFPRRGPIVGNPDMLPVLETQPGYFRVSELASTCERDRDTPYGRLQGTYLLAWDVIASEDVPPGVLRLYAERPVEGMVMTELRIVTEDEARLLVGARCTVPMSGVFAVGV